jgi:hypothetical protein
MEEYWLKRAILALEWLRITHPEYYQHLNKFL